MSTSLKIVFLLTTAVLLHIIFYVAVFIPDLYNSLETNVTLLDGKRPAGLTSIPPDISTALETVINVVVLVNSYGTVAVTVYIMELMNLITKRLVLRLEKFEHISHKRAIEGNRIIFIETENIINCVDQIFGLTLAVTLFIHYLIHLLGLIQLSFGFRDAFSSRISTQGLLNMVLGIFPLYFACKS